MKSLFLRVFLWFWLVMAVVVGLLVVLSPAWTRVRPAFARWEQHGFGRLANEAEMAGRVFADEGPERLREAIGRFDRFHRGALYLLERDGREVYGQEVPGIIAELAERAVAGGRPEFERDGMQLMVARPVTDSAGIEHVLVIVRGPMGRGGGPGPRPPRPIELLEPRVLLPLLALIVAVVGVLSFWLARYLASPVRSLRAATNRLSSGDLSARVGAPAARRRDEIGDLARDFDTMAERVEALVGSQRQLLRDVSHELRSPLARLEVALELARQRAGEEAAGQLERIGRESERLNELIEQLLILARLESGTVEPEFETVELRSLLEGLAEDAGFEAASHDCSVRLQAESPVEVGGSRSLLRSALENVIRNAVGYSGSGTEVEIDLGKEGREAVIRIRDRGPGVPEGEEERLFEPFYRVAEARERATGGTGLGLAIARRALRLHGGEVTARNHSEGGLEVTVRIPRPA
jgi:two-component system sensor histidine kinase CpxA